MTNDDDFDDDEDEDDDASPSSARPTSIITNDVIDNDDVFELGLENIRLSMKPRRNSNSTTFEEWYTLKNKLQCGSYGTVYVGLHNIRNREYAIKVVDRR
jgi:hypothetical protein